MPDIQKALSEVIARRQEDIAMAKRAILLGKTSEQRETLLKAAILLIYSALEGGIKNLCSVLFSEINTSELSPKDLEPAYLELALANVLKLSDPITDQDKKVKTTSEIRAAFLGNVKLPTTINTEHNLSHKVFSRVCRTLGVPYFLSNRQEIDLNLLLRFRNNIAHGDTDMPINLDRIDQFSALVQAILIDFSIEIETAHRSQRWLT